MTSPTFALSHARFLDAGSELDPEAHPAVVTPEGRKRTELSPVAATTGRRALPGTRIGPLSSAPPTIPQIDESEDDGC